MSDLLLPYGEMADTLDRLPLLAREHRRARGIGMRAAAAEVGTNVATWQRFEAGNVVSSRLPPKVLRWLAVQPVA